MIETAADYADLASDQHAKKLTASLRRHAYQAGWPAGVSRHLSVGHADGVFSVSYPDQVGTQVENLEYGTQSVFPNPAIRQFLNRVDTQSNDLDKTLSAFLGTMEVLP